MNVQWFENGCDSREKGFLLLFKSVRSNNFQHIWNSSTIPWRGHCQPIDFICYKKTKIQYFRTTNAYVISNKQIIINDSLISSITFCLSLSPTLTREKKTQYETWTHISAYFERYFWFFEHDSIETYFWSFFFSRTRDTNGHDTVWLGQILLLRIACIEKILASGINKKRKQRRRTATTASNLKQYFFEWKTSFLTCDHCQTLTAAKVSNFNNLRKFMVFFIWHFCTIFQSKWCLFIGSIKVIWWGCESFKEIETVLIKSPCLIMVF